MISDSEMRRVVNTLPFDAIASVIDGDDLIFRQNRNVIAELDNYDMRYLVRTMYRSFSRRVSEIDHHVPQSLKHTIVDAITLLFTNGLSYVDTWMLLVVKYAIKHGDIYTLSWVYQGKHRFVITRRNMIIVMSCANVVHIDSLKWYIENVSAYKFVYICAILSSSKDVADIINSL